LVGFYVEDINGKERFYHYVVVVFGLAPAGQLLGRVMRPILKALADRGVRNTMYVDDGRTVAGSKSRTDKDYEITLYLFKGAGFTVAEEKSDPIGPSSQRKVYLGFLIDTLTMTVEVPAAKLTRIIDLLKAFLTSSQHKVRQVASMIAKLNALEPALGKSVFVDTHLATITVVVATEVTDNARRRNNPWECNLNLDDETIAALRDINSQMEAWNGHPIRALHTSITLSSILLLEATASLDRKIPARRIHDRRAIMASNASDFAVASYSIDGLPDFSFLAELKEEEKVESSSARELLAILRTLDHMAASGGLKATAWTTLWWLTNNANVEKMIAKGSRKLRLTRLVIEILQKARGLFYNIQLILVSRDNPFLQKADCLSKGIDLDNWSVEVLDFSRLEARFGPFTVNLFATCKNKKCERFYSRSFEKGNYGTDAFA
jgi:hypothetical protein